MEPVTRQTRAREQASRATPPTKPAPAPAEPDAPPPTQRFEPSLEDRSWAAWCSSVGGFRSIDDCPSNHPAIVIKHHPKKANGKWGAPSTPTKTKRK